MTTQRELGTPIVRLPAGDFQMGSEEFYAEETPVRTVEVAAAATGSVVTVGQHPPEDTRHHSDDDGGEDRREQLVPKASG